MVWQSYGRLREWSLARGEPRSKILFDGYDHDHRAQVNLDGVFLTDAATYTYTYTFDNADVTFGPGGSNLQIPAGTDATLTGTPTKGTPVSCTGRFVPFPIN
jgi:polygalacturonase